MQLTLQSLVLLLHAQQQDLLVDGGLPEGPVVGARSFRPLPRKAASRRGQRTAQRIQTGACAARGEGQQLPAAIVV